MHYFDSSLHRLENGKVRTMDKTTQKGILTFDLEDYEAKKAFKRAVSADDLYRFADQLSDFLGRVNNNGYSCGDNQLQELIDKTDTTKDEDGYDSLIGDEIIRYIQKWVQEVLEDNNIDLRNWE